MALIKFDEIINEAEFISGLNRLVLGVDKLEKEFLGLQTVFNKIATTSNKAKDSIKNQAAQQIKLSQTTNTTTASVIKLEQSTEQLIIKEKKQAEQVKAVNLTMKSAVDQNKKYTTEVKELKNTVLALSDGTGKLNSKQKELLKRSGELASQQGLVNKAVQEAKKNADDLAILNSKEAGTLQKVAAESRLLRGEREKLNLETKTGQKRLVAINSTLDKNNQFIKTNSDSLKKQKLNVGNYTSSIKDALNSTGALGREFFILQQIQTTVSALYKAMAVDVKASTAATVASTTATGAMGKITLFTNLALKAFRVALISTGVGALVVALGSLIAFFTSTQRGADLVSKSVDGLKAGFAVLVDRLSGVGEALGLIFSGDFKDGFAQLKEQFKGIGDEIARETLEAKALTDQLQKLEDKEIDAIGVKAKLKKAVELNRLAAKDAAISEGERLVALDKAVDAEKKILNIELGFARERAQINDDRVKQGESTREEIKENAEIQARVTELETESLKRLRTIESERLSVLRKIKKERELEAKEKSKELGLTIEIDLLSRQLDGQLNKEEVEKILSENRIDRLQQELEAKRLAGEEDLDLEKELLTAKFELKDEQRKKDEDADKESLARRVEAEEEYRDRDLAVKESLKAAEISLQKAKSNAITQGLSILEGSLKDGTALQKLAFVANRAFAIGDIILKGIQETATIRLRTQAEALFAVGIALGNPLAAIPIQIKGLAELAASKLKTGVSVGLVAAQSIPSFAKGRKGGEFLSTALVGEAGREIYKDNKTGEVRLIDKPTLMPLAQGSDVIKNSETEKILSGQVIKTEPININKEPQKDSLSAKVLREVMNEALGNIKTTEIHRNERGASVYERTKGMRVNRLDKRYNF
jgi:hypothetical protein